MDTKKTVNLLWIELRQRINQAYAVADKTRNEDGICLRDYAENISWSDNLSALLGRESANERQHRARRPSAPGFSVETAAKLLLMENIRSGAAKEAMPSATTFLVFRQTAAEAQVIGFLIREYLDQEWRQAVESLDYAKLMKGRRMKPKKNTKEKVVWAQNEVDRLLDHISPALLHKIVEDRSKCGNPLVAFVEGGIVQSVLRVDSTAPKGYRFAEYELVDYDVFDTESGEDIKEIWDGFSPELQTYFRDHLKDDYAKFQERISGI